MNVHDAYELAYKNGYKAGYAAAQEEIDKLIDQYNDSEKERAIIAEERDEAICALEAKTKENVYSAMQMVEMDAQIAKLTAERDAAVADLREIHEKIVLCNLCKHKDDGEICDICALANNRDEEKWEWRGLSLETKTSDKEEKHE